MNFGFFVSSARCLPECLPNALSICRDAPYLIETDDVAVQPRRDRLVGVSEDSLDATGLPPALRMNLAAVWRKSWILVLASALARQAASVAAGFPPGQT
jgi:hypothetical protein